MTARNEDFLFAQEAQNLGYVTEAQVEEGFLLQRRMGDDLKIDERLAVILVKRGWMAEEQARRVYSIIEPEGARSRIEGYRLVQKIGRGAMGTVYKAIHKGLHRVVAIKILRRDLASDKTQIERLKREAQLLADLDHPNIVRALDAGESNGFPYLVMEYVEGETLRDKVARDGPLSNEEALRVTRALADALEKARRMGIVHRDVKPGNILMSKSGMPKLMDLGLAKGPLDPSLTQHGATVGTPQFMSPEQAESPDKADTRSDIYSLGASLYAMVTGRPPFEGSTLAEIIMKVMSQQPVPPRVRNPEVSPEVSHLIERMMLKDASLRYDTPAQVIADIDMIRGGQSIIPSGFQGNWEAYLLRKRFLTWRRRIAIGLAAVLVLAVGGGLWWKQRQREEARDEYQRLEAKAKELPAVRADMSLSKLKEYLAASENYAERMRDVGAPYGFASDSEEQIERRTDEYREAVRGLAKYMALERAVVDHLEAHRFQQAEEAARTGDYDDVVPARDDLKVLRARILADSDAALAEAAGRALVASSTTLDAFLAKWRGHAAVYEGNWVHTPAWKAGRDRAVLAAEKAAEVSATVLGFDDDFLEAKVRERVEALDLYELKKQVRGGREAAVADVAAHERAWPAGLDSPRLLEENGLAAVALAQPERRIDEAVRVYWEHLRAAARSDTSRAQRERIQDFENAAARGGYYPDLVAEAEGLRKDLERASEAARQQSLEVYERAREGALSALRRGRPEEIELRIDEALAQETLLVAAQRERLEGMRIAAATLRAVQDAALAWLATPEAQGQTLRDVPVHVATGGVMLYKQLRVAAVDTTSRTFTVRIARTGTRRKEDVSIGIGEVPLDRVLAWADRSGRALPASAPAFAALALLEPVADQPGRDLRAERGAYRRLAQEFDAPELVAWRAYVADLGARLDALQERREENARSAIGGADVWFNRPNKHKVALELYKDIYDPRGTLRHTDAYDKSAELIPSRIRICLEILAQQEIAKFWEGGVDVKETDGGRHIVLFDFDDLGQLKNFERGFARAQATPGTVTPDEQLRTRELLLLPDVRGVLRDRPLSLLDPFDPNEKIVLEVRVKTLRGSSILAFDIDGVQVAICSADPSWWKRRFAEGVPLLDGEQALPAFDYYGMGRGVAFHEGEHFGRTFPHGSWDWSPRSVGRLWDRWADPKYSKDLHKELFALEPARTYLVRIERLRGQMSLFVDDELILRKSKASWEQRGAQSDSNPKIRNGSGRIQILTWTPLVIDDLRLEGKISEHWKTRRRLEIEK